MSRAYVNYRERDLSAYAPVGTSYGAAIVLPAFKGERNKVHNVTSKAQLLKLFTPNNKVEVGMNVAFWSALKILEATNNLLVVVPKAEGSLRAGLELYKDIAPVAVAKGIENPQAYEFANSPSVLITASSEGVWGNDLYITNHFYKEDEKVELPAKESDEKEVFSLTLTQKWGNGFPVKLFSRSLPKELDPNETYFIRANGSKYEFYTKQKDAIDGTGEAIKVGKYAKGDFFVGPATQYTKIPNTTCIRVFHKSNLNDPVKTYIVSKDKKARDLDGNNLYIEDVIRDREFIEVSDNLQEGSLQLADVITPTALAQGNNGEAITTGDMIKALRYFENTNEYQFKFIGDGGYTVPAYQQRLEQLVKKRGDAFAVLSAPLTTQANVDTAAQEVVNYRKYDLNLNSSWAGLYAPHLKIYDEFNDREVWTSPDGFAIKAMIDTASNYEIWYPVAGNTRGVVSALDTKVHFTDGDQDLLYDNGVNPIIFDAGQGIKIWGQKTLLSQPSKLDRIHVRLLLITIGPALTKALRSKLFEFNDSPTRASVLAIVNSYMDRVLARRGVTKYLCVCDETNNLPADIANNIMNVDLIVCPNASVELINFTMAVINETVSFDLAQQQL
jgi:phage tail sheath protein|nr:MAG TPA: tail sheath protein [Caudoviricetes sp.]